MAAADQRVMPVGSTIRVDGQGRAYDGIYTVTMSVAVIRRGCGPTALPGEAQRR
jgi:hypothetical protein